MGKQICEICGNEYVYSCAKCTRRVETWGVDGTLKIIELSKRKDNIHASELLELCMSYYIGKSNKREAVTTAKTSIRILGYNGKFIGRIHKNGTTYVQIRQRENASARRWRLKKEACEICGSTENLYIHHIHPLSWGGVTSEENCITLCGVCHKKTHKKLKKYLSRELLIKYLKPHLEEIEEMARKTIT